MSDTGRKPDWVVRAKQSPDSDYFTTIGAGWSWQNGKDGVSIRLHSVPVMWTGELLLVRPLEAEAEEPPKKGKK